MAAIAWVPVRSKCLRRVALEGKRSPFVLRLHFVSGNYKAYRGVPEKLYEALLKAPSKGTFFNAFIKGKFDPA